MCSHYTVCAGLFSLFLKREIFWKCDSKGASLGWQECRFPKSKNKWDLIHRAIALKRSRLTQLLLHQSLFAFWNSPRAPLYFTAWLMRIIVGINSWLTHTCVHFQIVFTLMISDSRLSLSVSPPLLSLSLSLWGGVYPLSAHRVDSPHLSVAARMCEGEDTHTPVYGEIGHCSLNTLSLSLLHCFLSWDAIRPGSDKKHLKKKGESKAELKSLEDIDCSGVELAWCASKWDAGCIRLVQLMWG